MSSTDIAIRDRAQQALISNVRGDTFKSQVAMVLPPNVTPERFVRIATTALMTNPDIALLDHTSVLRAMVQAAADGLMPDGKEAAIVKRKNAGVYTPMIGGFRKIAGEHGWTLRTAVVYANDEFDHAVVDGEERINHRPVRPGTERGELVAAYAIAKHRDGRRMQVVLHPADIAKRRASATTDKVWNEHPAAMWEKSAGRDLFGQLSLADERAARLIAADELEPGEAAALMYGGDASRELPPAAAAVAPQQADGADREPQTASEPASSAPGATVEPEPDIGSPEGYNSPEVVDSDDLVIAAKHAALVEIPNGKHKGTTLGELVEKGEEATGWIRWALRNIGEPDEYRIALWNFARVYAPDVYQQVLAEKEAAAA